jgi:hypothetical protein
VLARGVNDHATTVRVAPLHLGREPRRLVLGLLLLAPLPFARGGRALGVSWVSGLIDRAVRLASGRLRSPVNFAPRADSRGRGILAHERGWMA